MIPLLALLVAAPGLPPVITLDEAVRVLRERGFDLLLADAQVAGAEADEAAAGQLANPQLGLSAGHSFGYSAACDGCSPNAFAVGLTDPSNLSDLVFGKRSLRKQVARLALEAARRSRDDALRSATLLVKQAVLDLALQQAQRELAGELRDLSAHTRALTQKRREAGAISEAEVARADVAALEAEQAVELAAQAARQAQLQLGFFLGARELEPGLSVDPAILDQPLAPDPGDVAALAPAALAARPDLLAAAQQEARAQAALELARRQRLPDVALSVQAQQEGTGDNALQPRTVTASAQFDLPVLNQRSGEIARAAADLRAQQVGLAKARAQALLELQAAHASLATARSLVRRMQGGLLARAERARDLVQIQYEQGATSLLDLLDARRTWAQTRAEYLKDLHDFWLAAFQLDAALGRT